MGELATLNKSPLTPAPETENPWTLVPVTKSKKSSKITSVGDNKCASCGKCCVRLLQHLRMKVACQGSYDMEALEKEQVAKLNDVAERKRKSRALRTPEKLEDERKKAKAGMEKFRENQSESEKEDDRKKAKADKRKFRENQSDTKKED